MRRREFINLVACGMGAALLPACSKEPRAERRAAGKRVVVVAFDGLDPRIVESLMRVGRLPNFSRLAKMGSFSRIATSIPAQTPVAFSNIISGADPGLHQVFDFIHRNPHPTGTSAAVLPHFSTAETVTPEHQWAISLGSWRLPLLGSTTTLTRRGPAFWDYLVERGIDTQIYYLPANFPPSQPQGPGRFRAISGMGTPDLLGSYGEFTLLTPDVPRQGHSVGGGRFTFLSMLGDHGRAELIGPPNFLSQPDSAGQVEPLKATVEIVRDVDHRVAKIKICSSTLLLREGEWSPWVPVDFSTGIPGGSVWHAAGAQTSLRGMVRLCLKQVYPKFELYVSPINVDPLDPVTPISVPAEFASDLARRHGRYYTIGIPEDTKALSHGALNEDQFLSQCELATRERVAQYREALAQFDRGCLFFYFGATDLLQHMFWRDRDEQHPGRVAEQAQRYAHVIDDMYVDQDQWVGEALAAVGPDDVVIVLSDHGFTTFRRGFNLNTWLVENGYMRQLPAFRLSQAELFPGVDWSATKAYGLGMNGLYLNAVGREKHGVVRLQASRSLREELRDRLMEVRDRDGTSVFGKVDLVEDIYPSADERVAPDLILGYSDGYGASWETPLGGIPGKLIADNLDRWSGTHLIADDLIPGVLLTSRPVRTAAPRITDIAPTILSAFGIPKPPHMIGRDLFSVPSTTS